MKAECITLARLDRALRTGIFDKASSRVLGTVAAAVDGITQGAPRDRSTLRANGHPPLTAFHSDAIRFFWRWNHGKVEIHESAACWAICGSRPGDILADPAISEKRSPRDEILMGDPGRCDAEATDGSALRQAFLGRPLRQQSTF